MSAERAPVRFDEVVDGPEHRDRSLPFDPPSEAWLPVLIGSCVLGYRTYGKEARRPADLLGKRVEELRALFRYRLAGNTNPVSLDRRAIEPVFSMIVARDRLARPVPSMRVEQDQFGEPTFLVSFTSRDAEFNCRDFARTFMPSAQPKEVDAAVEDALRKPKRYCADTMAARLGVTWDEHCRLGLDTLGAVDMPKAERDKLSREKKRDSDRAAASAKRRAAGAQTRREYEENSDTAFCREHGISPRTFRDWKTKGVVEQRLAERGIKTKSSIAAVRRPYSTLIDATDLGNDPLSPVAQELLGRAADNIRAALKDRQTKPGRAA